MSKGWGDLDRTARVFILCFFLITAVPQSTNYSPGAFGYCLVLVVLTALCLWFTNLRAWRLAPTSMEAAVVCLGAWLLLSVLWGSGSALLALLAALLACLSALAPWLLLRETTSRRALVGYVSAAGILGSAWAAFPMTWLAHPRLFVPRPGLPIGGASNNAVGLLLLAAGVLMMARVDRRSKPLWLALAAVDFLLIIQSFSRAAWVLGALVALAMWVRSTGSRRWSGVAAAATVGLLVVGQYVVRGGSAFGDGVRALATRNALQAWRHSGETIAIGLGPGGMWSWLDEEISLSGQSLPESFVRSSSWGDVLYHAHSTYVALLVERGVIGLCLFVAVLSYVVFHCFELMRGRDDLELPALVLVLTAFAMFVETYLLRSFPSAVLWWLFVWVVVDRSRQRRPLC